MYIQQNMAGYLGLSVSKQHQRNLPVPFLSQREVKYEWQRIARAGGERINEEDARPAMGIEARDYVEGVNIGFPISLAWTSCNIVSLCMLLQYYGITNDTPDMMLGKFFTMTGFTDPLSGRIVEHDFRHEPHAYNSGPRRLERWPLLREFAMKAYNLPGNYIIHQYRQLSIADVKSQTEKGNPVMISYGIVPFTAFYRGHIAVVRGFTTEDHIIINDPWGDIATPEGLLVSLFRSDPSGLEKGRFLARESHAINRTVRSNFSGLGNGDNAILRIDEFKKVVYQPLFNSMYINYPHMWSFPFNQRGSRFIFSSHDVNARVNTEEQVAAMLATEEIEDAGYPISTDRLWHDGLHIRGNDQPVYAIGPGRIVAARIQDVDKMPETGSNNFILIRHQQQIKRDEKKKEFYSHYLHLAPADFAARIRAGIAPNISDLCETDWIDQLIEKIRPKKAYIRIYQPVTNPVTPTGTVNPGIMPETFRYVNNEMISTNERLSNRSIIYLCPNDKIRYHLENINPDDELAPNKMNRFYSEVDKVESYIHEINNVDYYAYYHRRTETVSNRIAWEIRYVRAGIQNNHSDEKRRGDAIIPQVVNMPQFVYYRRLLARLLSGEVVTFSNEDDIDVFEGEKQNARQVFINSFVDIFMRSEGIEDISNFKIGTQRFTIPSHTNQLWGNIRNPLFNQIEAYYTAKITSATNNEGVLEVVTRLGVLIIDFGRDLLSRPADSVKERGDAFSLGSYWFTDILCLYRRVLIEGGLSAEDADNYVHCVRGNLLSSVRANVDYHIEVNGNTKLGMPGRYKNHNNIIHFDIFSGAVNLVDDTVSSWDSENKKFVKLPAIKEKNEFFNCRKIIDTLQEANFLKEDVFKIAGIIYGETLRKYMSNRSNVSLQYAIVERLHSHATLTEDIWTQIVNEGIGIHKALLDPEKLQEFLAFKWFSEEMLEELNPLDGHKFNRNNGIFAIFYHPVRLLEWLDKRMRENMPAKSAGNQSQTQNHTPAQPETPPPAPQTADGGAAEPTSALWFERDSDEPNLTEPRPEIFLDVAPRRNLGQRIMDNAANAVTNLAEAANNFRRLIKP